jgi:hypothetical protein
VPFRRDGWYPESLAGMDQMGSHLAEMLKQGPLYGIYAAAAPRVQDWPVLLDKTGELLRRDWDGSARSVARLAVLPGQTHYDIFGSPALAAAVTPFLDADSLEPPAPLGP